MLRRYKKINPLDFIVGFMFCFCKTNNTYSEWAEQTGRLCGTVISKQAFCKRITAQAAAFSKELLEKTVVHKVSTSIKFSLFNQFKKVILQDSTTLQLPDCLSLVLRAIAQMAFKKLLQEFLKQDMKYFLHPSQDILAVQLCIFLLLTN